MNNNTHKMNTNGNHLSHSSYITDTYQHIFDFFSWSIIW